MRLRHSITVLSILSLWVVTGLSVSAAVGPVVWQGLPEAKWVAPQFERIQIPNIHISSELEEGDIVIHEFMYYPPDGYLPYVELFNAGQQPVNLQGWELLRREGTEQGGGVITNEEIAIGPGELVVITPDVTTLSFIYGDLIAIEMDNFPAFGKQNGDDIRLITGEGVTVDSLRYRPEEWGGEGVSLERRRADFPSVYRENWAESTADNFGTPGAANSADPEYPFTVSSIQVGSGRDLFLTFTADVNPEDLDVSHFSVDGVYPVTADLIDTHIIRLSFDGGLRSGENTVRTAAIRSLPGWQLSGDEEFPFVVYDTYTGGEIVVNEFMYNPPPEYPAYVELYNRSDKYLNLRNWKLKRKEISSDPGGVITTSSLTLRPAGYMVITDRLESLENVYGKMEAIEMSEFPGFPATLPDQVRLFDPAGELADSLGYDPSAWGGREISLERKHPDVSSVYRENWGESPSVLLGTPGVANETEPDRDPPELTEIMLFDNRGFILRFNKTIDVQSATRTENFSFYPELSIQQIEAENDEILIRLRQELQSGSSYSITARGVADIFGNAMAPSERTVEFLEFEDARPGDLVINEILYRRENSGSPEFIELFNVSGKNMDLGGWIFSTGSGRAVLPPGTILREQGYVVLTDRVGSNAGSDRIVYLPGFPGLSNSGSEVVIRNPEGIVMDSLYYRPGWGENTPGVSLERKDPGAISIDPANWAGSRAEPGSTPAELNSRYQVDLTAPEILFANIFHPDSLEVVFNKFVDLQAGNAHLMSGQTGAGTRFLINGQEVSVLSYHPGSAGRIVIDTKPVRPGAGATLQFEGVRDFKGNSAAGTAEVARPPGERDLVINEIMYHPLADGSDGIPDQSEYLEIYNRRPYAISLEGIFLHDEPDENLAITRIDPVSTANRWIPAHGYALIYPEPEGLALSESRTGIYFDLPVEGDLFGLRADRSTLGLTLSGRPVYLADSTRTVLDMADYRPAWHNPNLITTHGISLERINPEMETGDPSNWGSNTTVRGGTPMGQNALYRQTGTESESTGITLTPNPFSPDGDGVNDRLFINYSFDDPDFMLKVRIYDRYGRLVRNLAEGHAAGFDGSLIWDGRTDNGESNRIGIYIVYVEAYNSSTGRKKEFRETAVMARQF